MDGFAHPKDSIKILTRNFSAGTAKMCSKVKMRRYSDTATAYLVLTWTISGATPRQRKAPESIFIFKGLIWLRGLATPDGCETKNTPLPDCFLQYRKCRWLRRVATPDSCDWSKTSFRNSRHKSLCQDCRKGVTRWTAPRPYEPRVHGMRASPHFASNTEALRHW